MRATLLTLALSTTLVIVRAFGDHGDFGATNERSPSKADAEANADTDTDDFPNTYHIVSDDPFNHDTNLLDDYDDLPYPSHSSFPLPSTTTSPSASSATLEPRWDPFMAQTFAARGCRRVDIHNYKPIHRCKAHGWASHWCGRVADCHKHPFKCAHHDMGMFTLMGMVMGPPNKQKCAAIASDPRNRKYLKGMGYMHGRREEEGVVVGLGGGAGGGALRW